MDITQIIIIVPVGIVLLALLLFLIWKNQKDKKALNPDAEDIVEDTKMDQHRNKESD